MKKIAIVVAAFSLSVAGFGASSVVAGNGKPPAPPGKDPCSHGNTGKPCRPDPQPDKGKDCEHHGKQGGVNEDHCKGETTTTTTPTETTPTTPTTPTTSTVTTPSETTPTVTTPTETTTPVVTPPPVRKPPVTQKKLDKELKKQVEELTPAQKRAVRADRPGELAHTGLPLIPVGILGLGLLGTGLATRKIS